jgi:hypothetical protein
MSEMRSATGARNFHSENRRGRAAFVNCFFADRLPETRPAGARIEFRLRAVKRIAARRADVSAVVVIEGVTAKRRQLRTRSAHDVELLRRQYDQPFFVREIDFLVERNSIQLRPYLRYINIAGMRARACGKCDANSHPQQKLNRSFHFRKSNYGFNQPPVAWIGGAVSPDLTQAARAVALSVPALLESKAVPVQRLP